MKHNILRSLFYLFLFGSFLFYQPNKLSIRGSGDSSGYYVYLPALFIHHDLLSLDKCNEVRRGYSGRGKSKTSKIENGNHLNQYTCGTAMLNAPAFFLAHIISKVTKYPSDGYSFPYHFMINFSGLIYIIIGFYFLTKFLSNYFDQQAITATVFVLSLGTNLYFTAVLQSSMAHGYLFCLVSVLLWLSQQLKQFGKTRYLFWIAFILGFITLIRPTVIIVGLVPLLVAPVQIWSKIQNLKNLLSSLIFFIVPLIPQFIYWKVITGDYITYSYKNQSFDFLNPHIIEGVFSFQNGWLIYSPIMLLAVIGLIIGATKRHRFILGLLVVTLIHIYIIYSWWCWNYINGFGSRAMIDIYPLLAFPICYVIHKTKKKKIQRNFLFSIIGLFAILNIFQTHQHFLKVLWSEGATRAYYFSVFGKSELNHNALIALDCNILQPKKLKYKQTIASENFEEIDSTKADTSIAFSGKKSYCIKPGNKFSKGIKTKLTGYKYDSSDWFKISAQCLSRNYGTFHQNSHLVISIKRGNDRLLWKSVRINNKIRDQYYSVHNGEINIWKEVYFFIPLEDLKLEEADQVSVYGWNTSNVPVNIDDLKLEIWTDP